MEVVFVGFNVPSFGEAADVILGAVVELNEHRVSCGATAPCTIDASNAVLDIAAAITMLGIMTPQEAAAVIKASMVLATA